MNTHLQNEERDKRIKELYWTTSTKRMIEIFGLTRQRIHQIVTGYKSPSDFVFNPLDLKILTKRKREALGLSINDLSHLKGSRDKVRELVRIRDNHTCRQCGKKWIVLQRRFDVHHLDESMDGKSRSKGITKYDISNMDKLITLCHKCHFNLDVTRKRMSKKLSPIPHS